MESLPYIDVHTHHTGNGKDTVRVLNLYPGDPIPVFKGRNFYSMGLHPWKLETKEENNINLEVMQEALDIDHVIFAGECGIDKVSGADLNEQKRVFMAQAVLAEECRKPLIIHCVRAYNEIAEIHKSIGPTVPWIFHGYTGNPELTAQLYARGFLFSFGRVLFSDKARAVASFQNLPLQTLFLETDEYNGHVEDIYRIAAKLRKISIMEVKETVWENFNRLENVSFTI